MIDTERACNGSVRTGNVLWRFSIFFTIIAGVALLYFGFLLPIQTDEIAQSYPNHRAFLDRYNITYIYPQCGESAYSRPLPWLWFLPAWINHVIYTPLDHPFDFRAIALVKLFTWLALWLLIIKRIFQLRWRQLSYASALILGVFSFDADFLMLLLARPEQSLVLAVSIVVALALYAPLMMGKPVWYCCGIILFLTTALQTGYAHPKAVALLPLFGVAGWILIIGALGCRKRALLFVCLVSALFLLSHTFWIQRLACPDSGAMRDYIASRQFPFHLIYTDFRAFLSEVLGDFAFAHIMDLSLVQLKSNWVNPVPLPSAALSMVVLIFASIAFLIRFMMLYAMAGHAAKILYQRLYSRCSFTPLQEQCNSLALSLLIVIGALFVFQTKVRPFYCGALEIPLILLMAILSFGVHKPWPKHTHLLGVIFIGSATAALTVTLLVYRAPSQGEVVVPNRIISFSTENYNARLPALYGLANECGIDLRGHHVVVNDITYLAFRRSFQPYHIFYATGGMMEERMPLKEFMAFLAKNGSDGIISDCRDFTDPMMPYAKRHEGFCCIDKKTIADLAENSPAAACHNNDTYRTSRVGLTPGIFVQ